jgi:hypothetical protein
MSTLKIKKIELIGQNRPKNRKVKVTLTNGTKITIVPCCESWEQFGGTTEELYVTVPVADKYNAWLHGAEEE